ncbi:hypothetical protein [Amycolatopsis sp. CB00013]|uniref:hypothetical protein n=1 Tax=Amycolatopsis sp. CB00013 TaxID=1703945 RepID=UPI00116128EE|nr:hypothetical protein [Amycolatopsis sp. CB00013]
MTKTWQQGERQMKTCPNLARLSASRIALESCQGLASMVQDELKLGPLAVGRRVNLLDTVLNAVLHDSREAALAGLNTTTQHKARQVDAYQVAAAGELLQLTDEAAFSKVLAVRCKQHGTTWSEMMEKVGKGGPATVRQLRAAQWLGWKNIGGMSRKRVELLAALLVALRVHLADEEVASALRTQFADDVESAAKKSDDDIPSSATADEKATTFVRMTDAPDTSDPMPSPKPHLGCLRSLSRTGRRWYALAGTALLIAAVVTAISLANDSSAPSHSQAASSSALAPSTAIEQHKLPTGPIRIDNTGSWGPERELFTSASPPSYAVFNSITDNSNYGDERNLITCRDKSRSDPLNNQLIAEDGHVYRCQVGIFNDVGDDLDDGRYSSGPARMFNARLLVHLPAEPIYNPGVAATLSANNAQSVWSNCNFVSPRPMKLIYQRGSTRLITLGLPTGGLQVPEEFQGEDMRSGLLVKPGILLGYDKQDGVVRHSGQYSVYVTFEIKIALESGV